MGWTEERVEQLKRLWLAGLSAREVAKQLGRVTRSAVIGKVHRLGLKARAKDKKLHPRGKRYKKVFRKGKVKRYLIAA